MTWLYRLFALALFCAASLSSAPAHAISPDELLPVDQAFVLSANAPSRDRIELHWKITPGYYLYRHRTQVEVVDPGQYAARPLVMPRGDAHRDEFFGDVETYRDELRAQLPGLAAATTSQISLKVKYQGCADAGICYPPQTRTVVVRLPGAAATATAAPAFVPLGKLGGNAGGLGKEPVAGTDAVPLPAEQAFAFEAIAFDGNQLLLRFTPAPGYYVYRDRTRMKLEGAPGISLQAPRWPKGVAHHDEHFGDVVVYFDQAEVAVPLQRSHGQAARGNLVVSFQGCQNHGICYPPMTRRVALSIPAGKLSPAATPAPVSATRIEPAQANSQTLAAPADTASEPVTVASEVARTTPPADVLRKASRGTRPLWLALLLALAGGLILNLMPCVLPVLSLKALSLTQHDRAKQSALWYTAGVMISFVAVGALVISLRAAGQALGWGFQLQQPWVVALLIYLIFAVGLSLSGVFAVGHRLAGTGHGLTGKSGPVGDFFTGVLAVVVASPCTAPFMGAALAFAFAAPTALALLVFAALGLGLALPFLLIGLIPALANRLPRPGAWMETLKNVLAFPMYLTAVWLLWVLGKQRGIDAVALALVGMVLLALGLWWWQRLRLRTAPLSRAMALLVLVVALVPLLLVQRLPVPASTALHADDNVLPYSAAKLAALRAEGRVVFVDMTADWCVTCKANEKAVLSQASFKQLMQANHAVLMTGDWTNVDPAITAFLESHHAVGVPLYVVYPADGGEGEVLPTVLTERIVTQALHRAAK